MVTVHKCTERASAIVWTVEHLGLPEGFTTLSDYADYVDELMDDAGYEEFYFKNAKGYPVAYVALCISNDIHHKGDILDITNIVLKPRSGYAPWVWRWVLAEATRRGCQWVSRCEHEHDGSIRNVFKRI